MSVLRRKYDPKLDTETLQVQVKAGPLVRVRVEGAKISRSKLKTLLPVYRDGVVDQPALAQSQAILEDYFQQHGYFSATVEAAQAFQTESQTLELTFQVARGKAGEFEGYGFEGNRLVPTGDLVAAIYPIRPGILTRGPLYSHTLLDTKVNSLKALYESRGFLAVHISPRVDDHFRGQPDHRFVTFQIEEGPQTLVHNLAFTGISKGVQTALWPSLRSKPTQPYSPGGAADRDTITNYLADLDTLRPK